MMTPVARPIGLMDFASAVQPWLAEAAGVAFEIGGSSNLLARHEFFGQPSARRRTSHVQRKTTRGWGVGGSPQGDRRGLSLVGAHDARDHWRRSSHRRGLALPIVRS